MADTPATQITDAMMHGIQAAALKAAFDQFYAEFHHLLELRDLEIRRLRNDLANLERRVLGPLPHTVVQVGSVDDITQPADQMAASGAPVEEQTGPAGAASSPPDGV